MNQRIPPFEELMAQLEPNPGSLWKHHSGRIYKVLFLTNERDSRQDKYPRTVVYEGENGKRWSGPLSDWYRRMTPAQTSGVDT
jgi:hypothetical protein